MCLEASSNNDSMLPHFLDKVKRIDREVEEYFIPDS